MRKIGDRKSNTALPFDQPGDFYYRRAMKFAQKYEYDKAVFSIRKAIDKDQSNIGYKLDLAGLLTEIEHFDDSNDLLFYVLRKSGEHQAECYFGLGCNFYGLSDYKKATSSLNKYLSMSPEGEYAEDAQMMLENISIDESLSEEETGFPDDQWKEALNEGDTKNAIDLLTSIEDDSVSNSTLIRNNLAVAYMLENNNDKALEICESILKEEPYNIHALCNMAMIKNRQGDAVSAKAHVLNAMSQDECEYSELLKISIALADLNMHADAVDVFYELLDENPYDLHTRHFLAIALFNCGEYSQSLQELKFISKFKPADSVNKWYINAVTQRMHNKSTIESFPYVHQVSADSVYSRINRINELIKNDKEETLWENSEFRELVLWAFDIKDEALKSSMITIIAKYAGGEAPKLLRAKLCSRHVSDDIKHKILLSLKKLGEKEPYIALMDDNIVEVSVNTFEVGLSEHLKLQRDIIELILANMPESYDIEYFKYIINTWNILVTKENLFDKITDSKLWAAALEYNYSFTHTDTASPEDVSIRYCVDMNEMLNLNKKIQKNIKGN